MCLSLEFEMADHDNKQKGSHTKLLCLTFCFNILHVDVKHSFFEKEKKYNFSKTVSPIRGAKNYHLSGITIV